MSDVLPQTTARAILKIAVEQRSARVGTIILPELVKDQFPSGDFALGFQYLVDHGWVDDYARLTHAGLAAAEDQ